MKLHMVAPHYPPNPQPSGRWVEAVGHRLASRDHEVVVHTRETAQDGSTLPPREEDDGVTVRRYAVPVHLGDQVVLFDPQVEEGTVLLNGYGILVNDRMLDRYDGPTFYHLHHGVHPPTGSLLSSVYQTFYEPLVASQRLDRCDGVLTSTDHHHARVVERGVDRGRILTAPYGLPADRLDGFAAVPSDAPEDPFVLCPGPLVRDRRLTDLLEALGGIADGRAVFAGRDGPAGDWIERRADEMGLADRVDVVRDPEEPLGLIRASRAVVLPRETGFPLRVLDAWSQARPVIAARTDAVPWVIDAGRTGLLYPRGDVGALRDHLRRLLDDDKGAEVLGQEGREAAERYRWDRIVDDVAAFLEEWS